MKMYQRGLLALSLSAAAAITANASEVLTIPAHAALPTDGDPSACVASAVFGFWGPTGGQCYLDFPLTIPVGHTIQQIAVVHSTNAMNPAGAFISSFVGTLTFSSVPAQENQLFLWSSFGQVLPSGSYDRHQLMAQVAAPKGTLYPDSFPIVAGTTYHVFVQLENTYLAGIEVTYN
jgi:hypothetical protein